MTARTRRRDDGTRPPTGGPTTTGQAPGASSSTGPTTLAADRVSRTLDGRLVSAGSPGGTLTEPLIADAYGVRAEVTRPGPGDRPHIRFLGTVAGH